MSDTIRAGVLLSLRDQFSPNIGKAGTAAERFGTGVVSAMGRVNRALSGATAKLGALGVTLGTGAAVKGVIDLQARLERLGTQANVSTERMDELKKKIYETAQAPDIKIDQGELIGAIDSIIERTGDMKFAEENLRAIGMAMQATGASGADIGGLFAEFQKMGLGADEAMRSLDTLTKQGKEGAFTLQNLAGLGPRTISAYAATGRSGETALREMGAALQVIRQGTGSSEQAATAFEAVMRNLTDPQKQKDLRKLGVAVRDQAGQFRPVTDIMTDIVVKSKGSIEAIGTLFDAEAVRAFNSAISEYQRTRTVASLQKFLSLQGDGSTILADSARNARILQANIQNLQGSFAKFADKNLTEPLGKLAEGLNKLAEDPERVQRVFKGIAFGLGALAAVKGAAGIVSTIASLKGGGAGMGNAASGLSGGGQPVFVTNWPVGLGSASGLAGGGKRLMGHASQSLGAVAETAAPAAMSRGAAALGAAKSMGKIGLIGGALTAVAGTIATLTNKDLSREEKFKGVGEALGTGAGLAGGTALGAAIGTAILPGVGTAVGAIGGTIVGALGAWLGGQGGRALGALAANKDAEIRAAQEGRKVPLDPWARRTGLPASASGGSMLPPGGQSGEIRFVAETRITDERTELSVFPDMIRMPGWDVNTGSAQEARSMP